MGDLADLGKVVAGCTYTGLKDTQIKFETKATKPQDFTCEVTHTIGMATCGIKCGLSTITCPKFSAYTAHCYYKVSNELKCAATFDYGGKKSGNFSVGVGYEVMKGTSLKAKADQDQAIHCSVKHAIAKGFTMIAGAKVDTKKGDYTYGLQLSIE